MTESMLRLGCLLLGVRRFEARWRLAKQGISLLSVGRSQNLRGYDEDCSSLESTQQGMLFVFSGKVVWSGYLAPI